MISFIRFNKFLQLTRSKPCGWSIWGELYSNYIKLTDKHTTIVLLNKSQNDTIKLTIIYMANSPNALALITNLKLEISLKEHWKWHESCYETDVTNIDSKCTYSPDYWPNVFAQRRNTFLDCYKLGLFRPMRRLHLLFRASALVLNTISAQWQFQTATPPPKHIYRIKQPSYVWRKKVMTHQASHAS